MIPTVPEVPHSSDLEIRSSPDPVVLSTGTYPFITSMPGYVVIDSNSGLTTTDNAFSRLTQVESFLQISNNANLGTLGSTFPVLVALGESTVGI